MTISKGPRIRTARWYLGSAVLTRAQPRADDRNQKNSTDFGWMIEPPGLSGLHGVNVGHIANASFGLGVLSQAAAETVPAA